MTLSASRTTAIVAWAVRVGIVLLGVTLTPARTPGAQSAASASSLSKDLRTHVESERFDVVTSIRGLPLGVRDALGAIFGNGVLDIAEPGAEFQATNGRGSATLPTRRLIAAGCSLDHCLVYYERGGAEHTWLLALFHWTPARTRFEWGGTAPRTLKTIADVRKAVLSGAIQGGNKNW